MKIITFAAWSFLLSVLPCQAGVPVVSEADTLLPSDLGIHKYVFEATPAAGQLMVIRGQKFLDGKLARTWESISDTMGKTGRDSILVINRSFFSNPDSDSSRHCVYQIAGVFKDRLPDADLRSRGGGGGPGVVEAEFKTAEGTVKYVFSVLVEDYDTVKKRLPDLRPMSPGSGWTVLTDHDEATR